MFAPDAKIPSIKSHLGSLSYCMQSSLRNLCVEFNKFVSWLPFDAPSKNCLSPEERG